jgi:hypothetical protein
LGTSPRTSARYPGVIDGTQWDKAALEAALKPVVEFQQAYGVRIYIGEFSAIRWAPDDSAHRYLADLIDIFERHGWDWSYMPSEQSARLRKTVCCGPTGPSPNDKSKLRSWYSTNPLALTTAHA